VAIEIREALSASDELAVARLGQIAFGRPGSVPALEQARRLKSSIRARATAWLLLADGEPASSLLQYPLVLRRGDEVRPAFGLGGVATEPSFRERGFASRLCADVAARHGGAGLLFSAIPPAFYERLGYVAVPAWNFRCNDPARLAASGPRAALTPLNPRREVARLATAWRAAHAGWYLDRDDARWATTLVDHPDDLWFGLESSGYLRLALDADGLEVIECCTVEAERDAALRAAAQLAVEAGAAEVTGWLDPSPLVTGHFTDTGRAKNLPMLLGVDEPRSARFSSADHF